MSNSHLKMFGEELKYGEKNKIVRESFAIRNVSETFKWRIRQRATGWLARARQARASRE